MGFPFRTVGRCLKDFDPTPPVNPLCDNPGTLPVFLLTLDHESTDRCFLYACYGNPIMHCVSK
jgi:hypothetical protein